MAGGNGPAPFRGSIMESNAKTISNVYGLFELDGYGGNMTWLGNWASRDEAI